MTASREKDSSGPAGARPPRLGASEKPIHQRTSPSSATAGLGGRTACLSRGTSCAHDRQTSIWRNRQTGGSPVERPANVLPPARVDGDRRVAASVRTGQRDRWRRRLLLWCLQHPGSGLAPSASSPAVERSLARARFPRIAGLTPARATCSSPPRSRAAATRSIPRITPFDRSRDCLWRLKRSHGCGGRFAPRAAVAWARRLVAGSGPMRSSDEPVGQPSQEDAAPIFSAFLVTPSVVLPYSSVWAEFDYLGSDVKDRCMPGA
jgi:hypothetical protein